MDRDVLQEKMKENVPIKSSMEISAIYKLLLNDPIRQQLTAVEELSELQQTITKNARGKFDKLAIMEEIADAEIPIEQMKMLYKIDEATIEKIKAIKIQRLEEYIKNNKYV